MKSTLPVIDMRPLLQQRGSSAKASTRRNPRTRTDDEAQTNVAVEKVAREIEAACRRNGFFYISGHGIPEQLQQDLEGVSRRFFALSEGEKMEISMARGGRAWRGYFPLGGELTSGQADQKEGLYFGTELTENDPRVRAGLPLHGSNLWPRQIGALRRIVTRYIAQTAEVAQILLGGVALSLGLNQDYFKRYYTSDPTVLFRIFHYPGVDKTTPDCWGVGEHTDYGLLTLLAQDHRGGLQVKSQGQWIDAPALKHCLVCNIGDMLDRLTAGWYVSTPHRVKAQTGSGRVSFPLFFDPAFDAEMRALPLSNGSPGTGPAMSSEPALRWDHANLQTFEGTYGDYLLSKVGKVFPALGQEVL